MVIVYSHQLNHGNSRSDIAIELKRSKDNTIWVVGAEPNVKVCRVMGYANRVHDQSARRGQEAGEAKEREHLTQKRKITACLVKVQTTFEINVAGAIHSQLTAF